MQCDLEAIKLSFYTTVNPKIVWKCRGLDNSSQKGYSTPSAPTKYPSTRCTSTANTKAIMENNWPLTWYYKNQTPSKRHALEKSQARCLFLVVWTKLKYRCRAFQRPQGIFKAMKHERWLLNCGKQVWLKMPFYCNFTTKGCSGALILSKQLTYKSEWAHKRSWEIIQHNSNNSEQSQSYFVKQFAFSLTSNKTKLPFRKCHALAKSQPGRCF